MVRMLKAEILIIRELILSLRLFVLMVVVVAVTYTLTNLLLTRMAVLVVVVVELLLMVLLDILTPPQGLEMREDSVQLKGMLEETLLIEPLGTITTTLVQVEAVAVRAVLEGLELPLAKHGQAVLVVMAVLV